MKNNPTHNIAKGLLAVIAAAFMPSQVSAQAEADSVAAPAAFNALDYRLQKATAIEHFEAPMRFGRSIFLSVEGAPTFTHRSEGQLIGRPDFGGRFGATIGGWFTPVHGMRVSINGGARRENGTRGGIFAGISADYLMHLSNLAHKIDPARKVDFIGVAGFEFQHRRRSTPHGNAFGAHLGLQVRYNVTPSTFIYVEPRFNVFTDAVNSRTSWLRYDWEGALFVGLGYRMNPGIARHNGRLEDSAAADNTFYGISAGALMRMRSPFTPIRETLSPQLSMHVGKWFTSISGLRAIATAGAFGVVGQGHPKFTAGEIDYLINLNSIMNGFDPTRRFNLNLFFGPAIAAVNRGGAKLRLGASVGAQGVISLTDNVQLVLEPKAMIFNNKFFQGYAGRTPNVLASVNLGVQYRLARFKADMDRLFDYSGDLAEFDASGKWFMSFGAGLLSSNKSFRDNVTAYMGFGKWFTPLSAWRVAIDGEYFNHIPRYASATLRADYMMSLVNLFGGYDSDRVFDLVASAGVHAGAAHYNGKMHGVVGAQAGLQALFNVSSDVALFLEPQLMTTKAPGHFRSLSDNWRLMAGINYKFGKERNRRAGLEWREANPLTSNRWYASVAAGPGVFSEAVNVRSFSRVCGGMNLAGGLETSSCSAVEFALGYDFTGRSGDSTIGIGSITANYLLDVSQLACYDPDRIFHISGLVGLGAGWSNYPGSSIGLAANLGVRFKWNVNRTFSIHAEPHASFYQPRVCAIPGNGHHFTGVAKLLVGAAYKF